MSRKLVLTPTIVALSQSLAANFNTTPTIIDYMDNCCYQINVTTSNSVGTFAVEASLDYVPANSSLGLPDSGNWAVLSMSGTPSVNMANDTIIINLNQLPFRAIRLAYTSSVAGTGTCEIIIMNKNVGS